MRSARDRLLWMGAEVREWILDPPAARRDRRPRPSTRSLPRSGIFGSLAGGARADLRDTDLPIPRPGNERRQRGAARAYRAAPGRHRILSGRLVSASVLDDLPSHRGGEPRRRPLRRGQAFDRNLGAALAGIGSPPASCDGQGPAAVALGVHAFMGAQLVRGVARLRRRDGAFAARDCEDARSR
jgi:hypothetical protein